jgi:hypothetical protein
MEQLQGIGLQDISQLFQKFTDNPAYQFVLKLFANDRFLKGLDGLLQFKNWKDLFIAQAITFVVLLFFRSWRMSLHEQGQWFARLWTGLWTSVLGWLVLIIGVPYFIIGPAFLDALMGIFEVAQNQPTQ